MKNKKVEENNSATRSATGYGYLTLKTLNLDIYCDYFSQEYKFFS